MSWRLGNIPSEILAHILCRHAASYLVVRLWKCGNRELNSRLAQGITWLDLRGFFRNEDLHRPLPSMVLELRNLRHLGVYTYGRLVAQITDLSPTLEMLPESLESLELGSSDLLPWLASMSLKPSHIPPINLAKCFPRLTHLALTPYENGVARLIDVNLLPVLPPTLTSLRHSVKWKGNDLDFIRILPPSLLVMDCIVDSSESLDERAAAWAHAPKNLHTLGILAGEYTSLAWLPRTIVSAAILTVSLVPEILPTFPPALSTIIINQVDLASLGNTWTSVLPKSLTKLILTDSKSSHLLGANIATLPASLAEFCVRRRNNQNLANWVEVEDAIKAGESSDPNFSFWPPSLTVLEFSGKLQSFESVHLLPSTLRSLTLPLRPHQLVSSNGPELAQIFPHITHLDLSDPDSYQVATRFALPPGITSLKLQKWRIDWFEDIPRSVIDLQIMDCEADWKESETKDLFAELPAGLRSLVIYFSECFDSEYPVLPASSFSTLRELRKLLVKEAELPIAVLGNLTPTLKSLSYVDKLGEEITPSDLAHMPPNLEYFQTAATLFNEESAQYWPVRCPPPAIYGPNFNAILKARIDKMLREDV